VTEYTTLPLRLGFFRDKKDNTPDKEQPITACESKQLGHSWLNVEIEEQIADWMIEHPEGKVMILQ
jgi:hypothetical protein